MSGFFVAGTDTGVGKTWVSCALLHGLRSAGHSVIGMKPVSAGCAETPEGLRNEDALSLQRLGLDAPYELINPFAYAPPIAPHLAAAAESRPIDLDHIEACYRQLSARAELVLVEGAGGWRVPLDEERSMADIPRRLRLGVVLVVGIRLGCLSHALLTREAIEADGLKLLGWVANCIEPPDANDDAQVSTLASRIHAPLLGVLPYAPGAEPAELAPLLNVEPLRPRD